ncbi:hypothetical protein ACLKA7_017634 [Drosophila subpalustris]
MKKPSEENHVIRDMANKRKGLAENTGDNFFKADTSILDSETQPKANRRRLQHPQQPQQPQHQQQPQHSRFACNSLIVEP